MNSEIDLFDELMIVLAPKVFDQCIQEEIHKDDDKYAFVNFVGRRTAFIAKQLVIERNRIVNREDDVFRSKNDM